MIFATVGSHPTYRFDRFLRALESLPGDDLAVQFGPGRVPTNARLAVAWMSFAEIVESMEKATHVISHAGVGTILCAVQAGHVPLVIPRLQRFGETVDDHQLGLARALAETGRVALVEEVETLPQRLRETPPRGEVAALGGGDLVASVRRELLGEAADEGALGYSKRL